jgi:CRP-like cAMP-binding protein
MEATRESEFFKRILKELHSTDLHRICCMNMTLEEASKQSSIYSIGDSSQCLYIVLNASVVLDIPKRLKTSISIPKEFQPTIKSLKQAVTSESFSHLDTDEQSLKSLFDDLISWDSKIIEDLHMCRNRDMSETINPGESFGILGVFSDRPRSHSAVASDKTFLAVLTRAGLKKSLQSYNEKKINDRIEFLHNLPLFAAWSRVSISKFLDLISHATYKASQKVFKEGENADFAIFVMSGEVKLTKAQITNKRVIESAEFVSSPAGPLRLGKAREMIVSNQLQLVVKGKNAIIGFDDLTSKALIRTYSCFCYSSRAEVLVVPKQVFIDRVNRPENLNYIKAKTSSENLWLNERVKEINSADLNIGRIVDNSQREHFEEVLSLQEGTGSLKPRPKTNASRARFNNSQIVVRRNSMTDHRVLSPPSTTFHKHRNSFAISKPLKPVPKRPLSRLPPPNFLSSFRKKKYGEPLDPPFFTYCNFNKSH